MVASQSIEAEKVAVELLKTPEGRTHPYPLYHQLRRLAPVHHSDTAKGWLLTRYEDCKAVLRDPRFEKRYEDTLDARSKRWRERPALVWAGKTLLNLDGPGHARLRRHVFRSFTYANVKQLRPKIESLTDELLDDLAAAAGGDLMERVAFRLPISVIGELLGVPAEDLPPFRQRVVALTASFELDSTRDERDRADEAALECIEYFDNLIATKRSQPDDGLISVLVNATDENGDRLTDEEINTLAMLVFFAGFETTTNMIGNGTLALLDQPEQLELLRDKPELRENLADELLRHQGTVQLLSRYTTEDVTIGDSVIPAGELVFPLIGAANRDPARYENPDMLDVTRTGIHPLAFGSGVHHCLGAALAQIEIEVVFGKLVDRFEVSELAEVRPPHRDRFTLRAPTEVQIRLGRRDKTSGPSMPARPAGDDAAWRAQFRRRSEDAAAALAPEQLADRVGLLARIPLFRGCSPSDLALLAATAYPISFDAGDVLCVEGGEANDAYVIVEGDARVTIGDKIVATVTTDDVVGERGPILDAPRAATVTATTHMLTLAISRDRLHQIMDSNESAAAAMKQVLAARYG